MLTRTKKYLALSRTEWKGLIVMVILMIVAMAAPRMYVYFHPPQPIDPTALNTAIAQLKRAGYTGDTARQASAKVPDKLFAFDPNNLSVTKWKQLGLTERQIRGIKNYEAAGGQFFSKADVKKMYTLTADDYRRLEPYISIGSRFATSTHTVVEINTADSAALTHLKGIGPGFARRIIQYRERLGGFHSKEQLKEIYGMDAMHYRDVQSQFRVNTRKVKKIDVNTVELSDIKDFPYLSYKQANALIQYRKQHGNYESFDELSNVAILDVEVLKKIKPYVVIR
jgi:competence protein ComEA